MAAINGSTVYLSLGGVRVNATMDKSYDEVVSILDATNQDSSGSRVVIADEFSASGQLTGMIDESVTYGYEQLRTAMLAKAAIAFTYGKGIKSSGAELLSGNLVLTGLSRSDPKSGIVIWTATFEITGLPTYGTSAATLA